MDGNAKAISLQGIVHNETKIGVQDGMCEDLVNLRFKDGSWRPSGAGLNTGYKFGRGNASMYFIHTNVYRHLLAVDSGKLYWVAILDADGNFYTGATGETACEEHDKAREVFYGTSGIYTPAEITSVSGKAKLTQTGNLLTVIDEEDDFEYFIFKTNTNQYVEVNVDVDGRQADRTLYPFGQVHFNCHCPFDKEHAYQEEFEVGSDTTYGLPAYYDTIKTGIKKKNQFAQPFLAIAAFKLYDGSYMYASPPTLIHPREKMNTLVKNGKGLAFPNYFAQQGEGGVPLGSGTANLNGGRQLVFEDGGTYHDDYYIGSDTDTITTNKVEFTNIVLGKNSVSGYAHNEMAFQDDYDGDENQCVGAFINLYSNYGAGATTDVRLYCALGSDLCLSIDESIVKNLNDAIVSLCVFVTPEADLFVVDNEGKLDLMHGAATMAETKTQHGDSSSSTIKNVTHMWRSPEYRDEAKVIYDLARSPFYLLREYNKSNIQELLDNPVVDLSAPEYEGLLENLVHNEPLPTEALARTTYLPKVSYNYNGRLHIANYESKQFHGYPIDLLQKNNHSVKYLEDGTYIGLANMANNNDEFLQYDKDSHTFYTDAYLIDEQTPVVWSVVEIETNNGTQKVCRYIKAESGLTLEGLNAMLSFPDMRAKKLTLYYVVDNASHLKKQEFPLKPHPYLNLAYHIDPEMKPIVWDDAHLWEVVEGTFHPEDIASLVEEENVSERFPNGLKVSSTEDPMYFPVKNTYQVGSAEILALCSNTIAVGTGQTGDAPLYVFCKDGVYALFVDTSGEMAYPNARAIARDVLNNPKSVTPIDAGVAFTTDRGLMLIAGEQVQEIGQPLEGDYVRIAVDAAKYGNIVNNAWTDARLAGLAGNAYTGADFLTFLKGSILNYNHNEWELMVSNPSYNYTYILDKNNAWSRRDYSARTYVNNYPSSYRVDSNGFFYQVDKQSDDDNRVFFLTREIKLDSIGFKSLQRVVVRGSFETKSTTTTVDNVETTEYKTLGLYVFGSHDARRWACLGHRERQGAFTDIGTLVERTDCKFFCFALAGQLKKESRLDYIEVSVLPSKLGTKIR